MGADELEPYRGTSARMPTAFMGWPAPHFPAQHGVGFGGEDR
jgi:hypothetical protein